MKERWLEQLATKNAIIDRSLQDNLDPNWKQVLDND